MMFVYKRTNGFSIKKLYNLKNNKSKIEDIIIFRFYKKWTPESVAAGKDARLLDTAISSLENRSRY